MLSSGSGEGPGVSYENSQFSGQVFSPPYLFAADGSPADPAAGSEARRQEGPEAAHAFPGLSR